MIPILRDIREWSKRQTPIRLFWLGMTVASMLFILVIALTFTYNYSQAPIPNTTFIAKLSSHATLEYYPKQDMHNLTLRYYPDNESSQLTVKSGVLRVGSTSKVFDSSKSFNLTPGVPIVYQFWSSGTSQRDQILRLSIVSIIDKTSYLDTTDYVIVTQDFSPSYEYIPGLSVESYSVGEITTETIILGD